MKYPNDETDKLKRFVSDNRDGFEEEFPEMDALWEKIDGQLPGPRLEVHRNTSRNGALWFWKVASVALALACGWLLYQQASSGRKDKPVLVAETEDKGISEMENYYVSQINQKKGAMLVLFEDSELSEEEIERELQVLDSAYNVLKRDWQDSKDERLQSAMVRNLKLRLEVLNRQIRLMSKNPKTKKDEEVSYI
ncbi:hypothetical protein FUAX_28230 [Fulvitalea axinellae]|uniref:Anti-sigma factor n=1 Tax=Fulvitalea axinellae TaxID=1182444 RepID=A0AAU9DBB4_9BACT|nr:hypothetical protein FUAX_28230 [Fulvitalea axinellae]